MKAICEKRYTCTIRHTCGCTTCGCTTCGLKQGGGRNRDGDPVPPEANNDSKKALTLESHPCRQRNGKEAQKLLTRTIFTRIISGVP